MTALERQIHWQNVYQTKGECDVSWFQEMPTISLDLIRATGVGPDASIIDIGGGASRLVDALIAEGFHSLSVLDVSEKALATSRERLGPVAANVAWIVADIAGWEPGKRYDLWHDRAAVPFPDGAGRPRSLRRTRANRGGSRRARYRRHICAGWAGAMQRPTCHPP